MININHLGLIVDERIIVRVFHQIEKGSMRTIKGIIVHQTDSSSAEGSFNSYRNGAAGAHLLIDKDGTIYQTASLFQQTWHVGKLRSRCLAELSCSASEMPIAKRFNPTGTHRRELQKSVPNRYPSNEDSIGIEIVGQALPLNEPNPDKRVYEELTVAQKDSLAWLVRVLTSKLGISTQEIFRHPTVSYKNATEAAGATW
ncbi:N-acetylmuramoyl-L-alanine amidase [Limnobacter humi]|uniref:N-acetylmuramoyl-L-alanine amidase n=1 Tax=Limnobacter humi TaxID=1778671 RepID=A0ABT1WG50_9BURK|nr:peptidoglycan recognition family protein [Limnobacter humi]MCQ8896494.1 N-acetylmuramoyl-L-alanine amidase [Limnobacter humi]